MFYMYFAFISDIPQATNTQCHQCPHAGQGHEHVTIARDHVIAVAATDRGQGQLGEAGMLRVLTTAVTVATRVRDHVIVAVAATGRGRPGTEALPITTMKAIRVVTRVGVDPVRDHVTPDVDVITVHRTSILT